MTGWRTFLVLLLVAAGLGGAWWWRDRPVVVATVQPHRGSAADVVYATGVVEPVRWAKVTSVLRERIIELCNCEGETVTRGTVLGQLDASDARATLAELQAREKLSAQELERAAGLVERRVISRQAFDRVENDHSRNVALVAAQSARLADYELRAPMDGKVLRRDGEVGEVAEPGEVLFWVGQAEPLQIVADINEEDIPLIRAGQTALVRADAFPGSTFDARVDRITPKGDPILKTYRVYLTFPAETPLMIGMTSDVNVIVREVADTLLIPLAALDGNRVHVLAGDGRLETRQLMVGIRGTTTVEVLDGLSEEERIVATWSDALRDGQKAKAQARADAASAPGAPEG
ncbi:efflux RND transporter periplasmic adaptor subunit [Stappia indica]|uniref:efflux RND transporter periplasmic adaptor subunit n=1 Tax=Stappia indica TaxID=538381 RepID=UPI001CD796DD|nr:efflux RND transporter periplasmic adaptor subunit [Stappia indica]MCA1297725.1 efflux RND transporter periplasmic adaptor subunit [Stappia indica]